MRQLLLSSLLLVATMASANTDQALQKCGEAKLSVMFWDVYESSLYTPTGRWQPDTRPLRLEIKYLRDIKAADLVKQTGKEWRAQGLSDQRHEQWLATLLTLWPDVRKGDVIALTIDANGASRFSINGNDVGGIAAPDFGQHFSGIWLSPNTTRPELRAALISGNPATGG